MFCFGKKFIEIIDEVDLFNLVFTDCAVRKKKCLRCSLTAYAA